jgi:hypothetical protein
VPDDVIRKLAGFTPAPPPVDPAEVLFRAGRESAPSRRPWQLLAAVLVASHAAWLIPRPTAEPAVPPMPAVVPAPAPDPASYLALSSRFDDPRPPAGPDAPDPPPLRAGSLPEFD